jgi:CheY-like chemotaxis protein
VVTVAKSGAEAIEKYEKHTDKDPFSLLVVDWQMPGMDGLELVHELKKQHEGEIPAVLMVTAYGLDTVRKAARDEEVDGLIIKPVNPSALYDSVNKILQLGKKKVAAHKEQKQNESDHTSYLTGKRILLVEDNEINMELALELLKDVGIDCESAWNGAEAIEKLKEATFDLVLMDIMIKGDLNGIQTAEIIRKQYAIPVIFLTAYADESTLAKAKISEPYGYIIKPYKEIDLQTAIEMATYKHQKEQEIMRERDFLFSVVENIEPSNDFVFVKSNSKLVKLNTKDIYFIEALKDYVVIHAEDTRFTIHSTMKEIESKLSQQEFLRVHRSYIVRMDKIASIEYPNLTLENDKKIIPIGGSYRDDLSARIQMV